MKDKKKLVTIAAVIIGVLIVVDLILLVTKNNQVYNNYDKYIVNVYKSNKSNVEEGINELLNTTEYKNLQKDEQIQSVGNLLRLYLDKKKIEGFNYNGSNQLYTYEKLDGTTSGIMLKDLSTLFDDEEETQE